MRLTCRGKIKAGLVSNEMVAHHDWLPTFLAMAGDADVKNKLLKGYTIGDMTYKAHLDGFNLVPYLTGEVQQSPREWFLYCNDDQQLVALRYDNWKFVFAEQRAPGGFQVWSEPFVTLRVPKLFNLRTDSIRPRRHHLGHLLRLVCQSGLCRAIPADIRGISSAPEGRQLQPR
jgi:arylsulfatase A-like enzyme